MKVIEGGWGVATLSFFFFLLLETRDFGSSAYAASSPSAKMAARERHLQESLFPINKCVHVLSHRRRRGWRPRGRRGQKPGILEWGNWSGSRKRYAAPAVTRLSSTTFVVLFGFFSKTSWMNRVHLTAPRVQPSPQIQRKLKMETVLYLPPEQLNLYSAVLQKSSSTRCLGRFFFFSD